MLRWRICHKKLKRSWIEGKWLDLYLLTRLLALENGPRITAIANDIAALRRVIQENGVVQANDDTQASTSVNPLTQQPLA